MTDTPTTQSLGVHNMATGSHTGDGTALTITLGFVPRRITMVNATDRITQDWYEGLAATQTINTAADGVRTLNTSSLIVVNSDRTVTVAAAANVNAKAYVWVAEG